MLHTLHSHIHYIFAPFYVIVLFDITRIYISYDTRYIFNTTSFLIVNQSLFVIFYKYFVTFYWIVGFDKYKLRSDKKIGMY